MSVVVKARGRIEDLDADVRRHLMDRAPDDEAAVIRDVADIVDDVRRRGDDALRDMARRFDGVDVDALEVPRERWDEARAGLSEPVRAALERAAVNIHRFHAAQRPGEVAVDVLPGVRITRRWGPLASVGVYAPGGRAAYPSSVLMGVVPAKTAGVEEIVVCSPPGPDGLPHPAVMAACAVGGASRLFAVGGAGAVAALAYGTDSVPATDAVVGPGNRWVAEAKRQVAGRVVIDSPAGPSEVLVLAGPGADPELVVAEVVAQAEHDPDAACVVVALSEEMADRVEAELVRALASAPRADVVREALENHGAILVADDLDAAVAFAEAYAPEHLSVMTVHAREVASRLTTAGTVFVGPWASVAFGDYVSGANHVLPTGGRARSFSGLSTVDFLRSWTVQEIDADGAAALALDTEVLAKAEGLPGHAAAARARRRK